MAFVGDNIFTAMLDEDGIIWEAGSGRKRQSVGIDNQKEQEYISQIAEMQEVIENYYKKLIELGAIVPPKTPEQIALEQAAQQSEINQKLLEAINGLQIELKELKSNGTFGDGNKLSFNTDRQNSKSNREKAAGSKGSDKPGTKDAAGNNEQP